MSQTQQSYLEAALNGLLLPLGYTSKILSSMVVKGHSVNILNVTLGNALPAPPTKYRNYFKKIKIISKSYYVWY